MRLCQPKLKECKGDSEERKWVGIAEKNPGYLCCWFWNWITNGFEIELYSQSEISDVGPKILLRKRRKLEFNM